MAFQNEYNARDFMQKIEKSLFAQCFILLGDEEGLKEKCIVKICDLIEKQYGKDSVAISRFHAESGDYKLFHEFILSPSMFATAKLAILSGINSIQTNNENKKIFLEILTKIPPTSYIIILANGYNIPKIFPNEQQNSIVIVKFWKMFQNEIEKYIIQLLNKLKIQYDHDALQTIIELLGNDIKKIDDAIEKISLSGQSKITKDFLYTFITNERESNIFEFIDNLLEKSTNSIQILHSLLLDGENELSILALLTRSFENLMLFHKGLKEKKAPSEILNSLGIKEKNKQKFIDYANNYPPELIKKIFVLIYEAEEKIKGGWHYKSMLSNPLIELTEKITFTLKNDNKINY